MAHAARMSGSIVVPHLHENRVTRATRLQADRIFLFNSATRAVRLGFFYGDIFIAQSTATETEGNAMKVTVQVYL